MTAADKSASEPGPDEGQSLFLRKAIVLHDRPVGWSATDGTTQNTYALLAVTEGCGQLRCPGIRFKLEEGDCLLLAPQTRYELNNAGDAAFGYYALSFERAAAADSADGHLDAQAVHRSRLAAKPFSLLAEELRAMLAGNAHGGAGLRRHRYYKHTEELVLCMLARNRASEDRGQPDSLLSVERTIAELRSGYHENWTIEQLAGMANLGSWQYRQLFKRLTGRNPNDYIAELRIERAKELLLVSREPLAAIAQSVGYQDEYYFNRRFRQMAGSSPRQYIRNKRTQMKVAAFTHFGDFMSLGCKPAAADESLLRWLGGPYADNVQSIAASAKGLDQMAELQPDLILVNSYTEPAFAAELRHIAPTVMLPNEADMFGRLDELAELLGKRSEAKAWLARYGAAARQLQTTFKKEICRGETAVFLHVVNKALYLYRPEEAPVLYEVIGFEVPEALKKLIAARAAERLFVPEDAFGEYEADRIFIVAGRMEGAQDTLERMMKHPRWPSMQAVRSKRVYLVDETWALDGTIALEWQMEGLAGLIGNARSRY